MPAGIVPLRGTFSNEVVTLTNTPGYAIINTGSATMYIRNAAADANGDSTAVPAGASFSSFANFPYNQAGYSRVVLDGTGTSFTLEALPGSWDQ